MWSPSEGKTYDQLLSRVHAVIDAASGSSEANFVRALDQRENLARHRPQPPELGAPCAVCGDPWPCGPIEFLLTLG